MSRSLDLRRFGGPMSLHQFSRLPVSIFQPGHCSRRRALVAATALSAISCSGAWAADGDANEALLKKMERMEQRMQMLEGKLKQKQATAQVSPATPPAAPCLMLSPQHLRSQPRLRAPQERKSRAPRHLRPRRRPQTMALWGLPIHPFLVSASERMAKSNSVPSKIQPPMASGKKASTLIG